MGRTATGRQGENATSAPTGATRRKRIHYAGDGIAINREEGSVPCLISPTIETPPRTFHSEEGESPMEIHQQL
jgi:hypothetical protein